MEQKDFQELFGKETMTSSRTPAGGGPVKPNNQMALWWGLGLGVGGLVVILVLALLPWKKWFPDDNEDDENPPKRQGYLCDPGTKRCVLTDQEDLIRYPEHQLADCKQQCEERYYCDRTDPFSLPTCRLAAGSTVNPGSTFEKLLECEADCVPWTEEEEEEERYSCDRLTGSCVPDPAGASVSRQECEKTCSMQLFACDEDTGDCVETEGSGQSLEQCRSECKFQCDPTEGGCWKSRQGVLTKAECLQQCTFSCREESGDCQLSPGAGGSLRDCRLGCRFKCDPQTGECLPSTDPDASSLRGCQERCRFSCDAEAGYVCVPDPLNPQAKSLAECQQGCDPGEGGGEEGEGLYVCDPDRWVCIYKEDATEGLPTRAECEDLCLVEPPIGEEDEPTEIYLEAVDPAFKIYEGILRWTDRLNCDRFVYLQPQANPGQQRLDFYYNRGTKNWKLNTYALRDQIIRDQPCFQLNELAYGYSSNFSTLRHPITQQVVMNIIPRSFSSEVPKLSF